MRSIVIKDLSYQERYDWWIRHNYETGIEYNPDVDPNFDDGYWVPTPIKVMIIDENDVLIEKIYFTKEKWREYQLNGII
jgi:hypothetical protein